MSAGNKIIRLVQWAAAAFLAVCICGCGGQDEAFQEIRESYEALQQQGGQSSGRSSRSTNEEIIKMVRTSPVRSGEITVDEWLDHQLKKDELAQVMFPRWSVKRRGAHVYEVRFTYRMIRRDYEIEKAGYLWIVNVAMSTVGDPHRLSHEDLEPGGGERMRREFQQ